MDGVLHKLDGAGLSAEAVRVWVALSVGHNGTTQALADRCFAKDHKAERTRLRHTLAALQELTEAGLLEEKEGGSLVVQGLPDVKQSTVKDNRIPEQWLITLMYILYHHTTVEALLPMHWKQLYWLWQRLTKLGAEYGDVQQWFKSTWRRQWPGSTGQSPKPNQVVSGVAAYLSPPPQDIIVPEVKPAGSIEW